MWQEFFEIVFFIEPASGIIWVDFFLPIVLSALLYGFSYRFVGDLYASGTISGSAIGSFLHWGIRLGIVYIIIWLFNLVLSNLIAFIAPFIGVFLLIIYVKLKS